MWDETTGRNTLSELWSVENNISLANMDWEDFENPTDNSVLRGF
ncbi:DUF6924 domain-containing protein [Streptomyces sp. st170]